jgi:hypothetical protein
MSYHIRDHTPPCIHGARATNIKWCDRLIYIRLGRLGQMEKCTLSKMPPPSGMVFLVIGRRACVNRYIITTIYHNNNNKVLISDVGFIPSFPTTPPTYDMLHVASHSAPSKSIRSVPFWRGYDSYSNRQIKSFVSHAVGVILDRPPLRMSL